VTITTQNLDVVRVDEARGLLLVRGAVPGSKNGFVTVRLAAKGQPKPVQVQAKAEKGKK
jgi:large subunit ribosomal protein L3